MPSRRGKIEGSLYGNGEETYKKAWNVCLKACPELELWTEQLMVYFVFTYFCGSVYNENPYGKLKMALASVLIIQDMALERFYGAGKPGCKGHGGCSTHLFQRGGAFRRKPPALGGAPYKGSAVWIEGFSGGHAVRD